MPEGDSVLVAATRLDAALAGTLLRRTDFRVPRFAVSDLSGQRVVGAGARGKHLFLRTDGGVSVHTHFGMDGTWHLYRLGERWRGGAHHEVRAVLETEERVAVGYRLPTLELIPTVREVHVLAHLGPDVLGPDWDPKEAVRRLRARPDRSIGEALIDQTVMAGPGNVYKCEALFLRGIDPWSLVGTVQALDPLVAVLARLMDANRATGRQITTGVDVPGRERWVHGRAGRPCRRCGAAIRKRMQTPAARSGLATEIEGLDRVTYWCPRCQPSRAAA